MGTVIEIDSLILRDKVRDIFSKNSRSMTPMIAQQLGVTECEIVRCLPDERSKELDPKRIQDLIRDFAPLGDVDVIVSNGVVVLEAHGQFGGFSVTGPFLNVQTPSLDMHISHAKLAAAFAVVKPGHMDGVETISFQFFSTDGSSAFKVFLTFGGQEPTAERFKQFDQLRSRFMLRQTAI